MQGRVGGGSYSYRTDINCPSHWVDPATAAAAMAAEAVGSAPVAFVAG